MILVPCVVVWSLKLVGDFVLIILATSLEPNCLLSHGGMVQGIFTVQFRHQGK